MQVLKNNIKYHLNTYSVTQTHRHLLNYLRLAVITLYIISILKLFRKFIIVFYAWCEFCYNYSASMPAIILYELLEEHIYVYTYLYTRRRKRISDQRNVRAVHTKRPMEWSLFYLPVLKRDPRGGEWRVYIYIYIKRRHVYSLSRCPSASRAHFTYTHTHTPAYIF